MNLGQTREEVTASSSQEWLGSAHGTDTADSITLLGTDLAGSDFEGKVPSGVLVTENGDGLFVLGDGGTGRAYLLLEAARTDRGNQSKAGFWHGQVLIDRLPEGHGIHAGNVDRLPLINFVGEIPEDPEA